MSEEWGPWIEHDGKGCPCMGMWVQVQNLNACRIWEGVACSEGGRSWDWSTGYRPVVRYRIRRPRALLQLIEMVENLPAPAQPRVDA